MPPVKDPVTGKFVSAADAAAVIDPNDKPPGQDAPPAAGGEPGAKDGAGAEGKPKPADTKNLKKMIGTFLGIKAKEPEPSNPAAAEPAKEKPVEGEPPKPKQEGEPTPPPAKPKTPAKPKKPAASAQTPAQLTAEQIASAAAEGATRAMKSAQDKQPPAGADASADQGLDADLSPADKRRVEIYSHMEKLYPDRYKSLAQNYRDFLKRVASYAEQWEKDNPGQSFDPDDEQHAKFYDDNEPQTDDEDYTEAIADIRADAKLAEKTKGIDEKFSAIEKAEKIREAEPLITQHRAAGLSLYWKEFGPEFETLDAKKFDELTKADPENMKIRFAGAQQLAAEATETYKICQGLIGIDLEKPVHQAINNLGYDLEQKLLAQSKEDQKDAQGRPFLPLSQYLSLKPEARNKFWTISEEILTPMRAQQIAADIKKRLEEEEERFIAQAKARGIELPAKPAKPATAQAQRNGEPAEEGDDNDGKPVSPSAAGQTKMAAARSATGGNPPKGVNAFVSGFLGKR